MRTQIPTNVPKQRVTKRVVRRYVRRHLVEQTVSTAHKNKIVATKKQVRQPRERKRMLALLIAAHNEELVIENTIRSAINAGMNPKDIYVVDDCSTDKTTALARAIVGHDNAYKVKRSGKGLALTKAAKKFDLVQRYRWIHIADADGGFAPNYFPVFRKSLRNNYAAATGYIKSLPGNSVSQYRVFEYTVGMEIHRRFQALAHVVSVIPGPTSCFRSDVFAKVNFANRALTEDLDVTLQIHRQKLGKIQFIPGAVAYTQDPRTVADYTKQITRWNRGVLQGVRRHKIGHKAQRIDIYLTFQIFQNLLFFFNYCFLIPYLSIVRHSPDLVATLFLYDVFTTLALTMMVALRSGRWDIMSAFPQVYAFRFINLAVFIRAFVEITILRKFKVTDGTWSTAGRRYRPVPLT